MSSNLSVSLSVDLRSGGSVTVGLSKSAARQVRRHYKGRNVRHSVMKVHGLTLYHRFDDCYMPWQEAVEKNPSSLAGLAYLAGRVVIGDTEYTLPRQARIEGDVIVGTYADGSETVFGEASQENCAALGHLRVLNGVEPAVEVSIADDVTLSLSKASVEYITEEKVDRHVRHSVLVVRGDGVFHRRYKETFSIPAAVRRFPASLAGFAKLAGTVTINGNHYETPQAASVSNDRIIFEYRNGDTLDFGPATEANREAMKRLRLLS